MKKLSQFINEAKNELKIQDDTINFIDSKKLAKYAEICKKFLSEDALYIIGWLMDNNSTYVQDFMKDKKENGNALEDFYKGGVPKDPDLKELYKAIGNLNKKGLLMQVPVFQTEEQFENIISKKVAPDEVFLDLKTEAGRNEVAKKYDALVWKIARSFNNKSTFTLDELHSIGQEGLTWAMNNYGKSRKDTQKNKLKDKTDAEIDALIDEENEKARKSYTFLSYASYMIRIAILEAIKNESHTVSIPVSQQNKERKETGKNTKSKSVSGDAGIMKDKEGNTKTLFDTIASAESGDKYIDDATVKDLWDDIYKAICKKFPQRTVEIFCHSFGIFGYEKLSGKESKAKFGLKNDSEISNIKSKVINYLKNNKSLKNALAEIYSTLEESKQDEDDDYNPVYLSPKIDNLVNKRLEEQNQYENKNDMDF